VDEAVVVFYSLRVVSGDPNPRVFFDYPGFFLYLLAAVFKVSLALLRLVGRTVPPNDQVFSTYTLGGGLSFLLLESRAVSAVLSAVLAPLLYRVGKGRWGLWAGLTAASLWAVNPLAVAQAHYATVDTTAALLTFLAVERLVRYLDGGARRDGMWASVFTGLGAATKYYPGVLAAFLAAAAFRRDPRPRRTAGLFVLTAVGVFSAASPYTVLEAGAFAGRFMHIFRAVIGGGGGGTTMVGPTLAGLWQNMGVVALLASAFGAALFMKSSSDGDRLLSWVAIFLILFVGMWRVQLPHYALAAYPLLFLAAGRAVVEAGRRRRFLAPAAAVLLTLAAVPGTVRYLRRISVPDTRLRALAWAREVLPPGSRVLRFARTPEFSPRDPFAVTVDWENQRLASGPGTLDAAGFDTVWYGTYDPSEDPIPQALSARFHLLKSFDDPKPSFPHHPAVYVFSRKEG
jgi:4-amino-4-deoxy-L-arabinose transferase-like glycosyltransferase